MAEASAEARTGTGPAFRVEGLTKVYGMGEVAVHALRGVDLEIPTGELVFILGTSGSGKSTLVNILGGLDRATEGRVFFRDLELTAASDRALTFYRRDSVGFIFQMYNLMPSLTARENVALVTEIDRDAMRPEEALAIVGLEDRLNHFPAQLSGGEQQRVAIARAIAKQPEVLLCDEPTGALDSKTGIRVLEAINKVNVELSTTVVVISHNADMAAIGDRTLFMSDGRIVNETRNARRQAPSSLAW
ncbi:ABC transporter ATP-binding protein [Afifella pfennigii]|uniref:ABC transporter ATP-binding protein n=1 Tax=Afifella pfennigii TaxID=209897 RepID=UPI00047B5DD2|nr:ABC transporter ATP-binding protein [Afifella pfennigii]